MICSNPVRFAVVSPLYLFRSVRLPTGPTSARTYPALPCQALCWLIFIPWLHHCDVEKGPHGEGSNYHCPLPGLPPVAEGTGSLDWRHGGILGQPLTI